MTAVSRIFRLLALSVWIGGIIFFAFVVAPVAFTALPDTHVAGLVVAGSLRALDSIGIVCAVVLLFTTAGLWGSRVSHRLLAIETVLILLMAAATGAIKWNVIPRMERDRIAAGGDINAAPPDNPARLDFERMHPVSEKLEGAALLLGLALIVTVGLERPAASTFRAQTAPPQELHTPAKR